MLQLLVSDIQEYVKTRLDELSNNDDAMLLSSDDALADLDKIVSASVVPSVRMVELAAPNILLGGCQTFTMTSPVKDWVGNMYRYRFALPSGFMRLVSLRMSDWKRPIQTLLGEDSPEYRRQTNMFLMGTPSKPVGFLMKDASGAVVELYSCGTDTATLSVGLYLAEPAISGTGASAYVAIPTSLKWACLDMVTASVMRSLGMHQAASVYEGRVADALSVTPEALRTSSMTGERVNPSMNKTN